MTPLHYVVLCGHKDVVTLLLSAGASVSVVDEEGLTPLHHAAAQGQSDVLTLLLSAGASLSVVNKQVIKPSVKLRQLDIKLLQ